MTSSNIFNALVTLYNINSNDGDTDNTQRIEHIMTVRYNQPLYKVYNWVNEGGDPQIDYIGYDLEDAQQAFEAAERIDSYKNRNQEWLLEAILDDNYKVLASKEIPAINDSTNAILYNVQNHFGGKYNNYVLPNGEFLKLRIADHSGLIKNVDGEYISIVISNDNPTATFKMSGMGMGNEFIFEDSYSEEEIINQINQMLIAAGIQP